MQQFKTAVQALWNIPHTADRSCQVSSLIQSSFIPKIEEKEDR